LIFQAAGTFLCRFIGTGDVTERLVGGAVQFCLFLASTALDTKYSQSLSSAGVGVPHNRDTGRNNVERSTSSSNL